MKTFAICSVAQAHSIRNTISTSKFKQASFATYKTNETRRREPWQRLRSTHSRQRLHIVAARTESVDMPVGIAVPDFEVSLVCRLDYECQLETT